MDTGLTYLVTTQNWLIAPDGQLYRAVFGTLKAIKKADDTLNIKPGRGHANWYLEIGNMTIAGCDANFIIQTDSYNASPTTSEIDYEDKRVGVLNTATRIYNANKDYREST